MAARIFNGLIRLGSEKVGRAADQHAGSIAGLFELRRFHDPGTEIVAAQNQDGIRFLGAVVLNQALRGSGQQGRPEQDGRATQ